MPVQFRVQSGNATDDRSHRATRDPLCKLTGRHDFLYVADCKPATTENMASIHRHGGRFLSVLPRTRAEDAAFRAEILAGRVHWRRIHDKDDDEGELGDRFSIHEPEPASVEGYRLVGSHSTRQAELDARARQQRIERAVRQLTELQEKLAAPRTRHRERAKVAAAVEAILTETETEGWIEVTIAERIAFYELRLPPHKAGAYVVTFTYRNRQVHGLFEDRSMKPWTGEVSAATILVVR